MLHEIPRKIDSYSDNHHLQNISAKDDVKVTADDTFYQGNGFLTPCKAIRSNCKGCGEGTCKNIFDCPIKTCPLLKLRHGKRSKGVRPIKSIRLYCLSCCGGKSHEVAQCHLKNCPLHVYRHGHRPRMPISAPKQPLQMGLGGQTPLKATPDKGSKRFSGKPSPARPFFKIEMDHYSRNNEFQR